MHPLPVQQQSQHPKLARLTVYYQPTPVSKMVLALMRLIDELHLQYPFAGVEDATQSLDAQWPNRRAATGGDIDAPLGIEALCRKPSPIYMLCFQPLGRLLTPHR